MDGIEHVRSALEPLQHAVNKGGSKLLGVVVGDAGRIDMATDITRKGTRQPVNAVTFRKVLVELREEGAVTREHRRHNLHQLHSIRPVRTGRPNGHARGSGLDRA